jgi:hypothetical protein
MQSIVAFQILGIVSRMQPSLSADNTRKCRETVRNSIGKQQCPLMH